jgi:thioredoxin reductase
MYDVIIVGGGPAGLSAALVLGRCRRSVLVCDDGRYRNEASLGLHGFLSRDGIHPSELRRIGREQLARYDVEYRRVNVADAHSVNGAFEVTVGDGERIACRKLLLATGVIDCVPAIEGIEQFYGSSVFHCPYCDGWEVRDQPIAVYGRGKDGLGLALSLKTWSDDIVLCSDGPAELHADEAARLEAGGIAVREERIARLRGMGDVLQEILFRDGSALPRRAMFFSAGQSQRSDLVSRLGCDFTRKGTVRTGKLEGTNIPGLYVAGDASKDVQFAIVAAAEGAKAAIAIDTALRQERNGR